MLFLNAMIDNGNLQEGDAELFFGGDEPEPVEIFPAGTTMIDLLIHLGVFKSRGQAKKNWKGPQEIPEGFSDFTGIGKLRRELWILNPVDICVLNPIKEENEKHTNTLVPE